MAASLLSPVGAAYGQVARVLYERGTPYRCTLPVVCVGNLTAGGTGKTPLALYICEHLKRTGHEPVALTRGYGGGLAGPYWVNAGTDKARDVGDIVLVDGVRGIGNGMVIPAGPLRAALDFQLELTDAVVVNEPVPGAGDRVAEWMRNRFNGPVLRATAVPAGDASWLKGLRVVAWAGIGSPQRFFSLLTHLGAEIIESVAFRDHQSVHEADADRLLAQAEWHDATLVTTEKDQARMSGATGMLARLTEASRVLPIKLSFEDADAVRLASLLDTALKTQRG